jgi:hypothetical protein
LFSVSFDKAGAVIIEINNNIPAAVIILIFISEGPSCPDTGR